MHIAITDWRQIAPTIDCSWSLLFLIFLPKRFSRRVADQNKIQCNFQFSLILYMPRFNSYNLILIFIFPDRLCINSNKFNYFYSFKTPNLMEDKIQTAVVLNEYGQKVHLKKDQPIPTLNEGELLIKVQASTINPSDRLFLSGSYFHRPLPALCGFEGTGIVVQAKGEALQTWVGKRVCFTSTIGAWCQYAVSTPLNTFEIDEDIPLSTASSGIINPLTVIGFAEVFRSLKCKGIIHTAASSALGKMLIKYCQKENIPLLNLVRREEQAEALRKQGATHILVTEDNWEKQLKQQVERFEFNCVFDALGGGPVTQGILSNLGPNSSYFLYGFLQNKPLHLSKTSVLFSGLTIAGFLVFDWWAKASQQTQKRVRNVYSSLLRSTLITVTCEEVGLDRIEEGLEISLRRANEGKVLLKVE